MATLTIPNDFVAGAAIIATDMNANFTALETFVNTTPGVLQITGGTVTGAVTLSNTLTVGADDTGYDVKLWGATTGKYMLWDESEDRLEVAGTVKQDGVIGRIAPTGVVLPFAGASIPSGWLLCAGTAVSRTTYANLFAVISTTYGVGDGSSTFNIPDLQSRAPVGHNSSDTNHDVLGETGGAATVTLALTDVPAHGHEIYGSTGGGGTPYRKVVTSLGDNYTGGLYTVRGTSAEIEQVGGGGAHNNLQPYITLYYIIAI